MRPADSGPVRFWRACASRSCTTAWRPGPAVHSLPTRWPPCWGGHQARSPARWPGWPHAAAPSYTAPGRAGTPPSPRRRTPRLRSGPGGCPLRPSSGSTPRSARHSTTRSGGGSWTTTPRLRRPRAGPDSARQVVGTGRGGPVPGHHRHRPAVRAVSPGRLPGPAARRDPRAALVRHRPQGRVHRHQPQHRPARLRHRGRHTQERGKRARRRPGRRYGHRPEGPPCTPGPRAPSARPRLPGRRAGVREGGRDSPAPGVCLSAPESPHQGRRGPGHHLPPAAAHSGVAVWQVRRTSPSGGRRPVLQEGGSC
jgi:hypothetical protein